MQSKLAKQHIDTLKKMPLKKRLEFVNEMNTMKTPMQTLKILEEQFSFILQITKLNESKNEAINKQDYERALELRKQEQILLKKQSPFIDCYNLIRKQLGMPKYKPTK